MMTVKSLPSGLTNDTIDPPCFRPWTPDPCWRYNQLTLVNCVVWAEQVQSLHNSMMMMMIIIIIITRCVAMPSLMAARSVGHNSGHIFRHLWSKVHQIKSACVEVSVVGNTVFWLTMSCCIPEIFVIKSWSCPKSRRILTFSAAKFRGKGYPNF